MAEIQGGPMAHQFHHRGIQSIMNHHHMDIDCHQTGLEIHPDNISKFKILANHFRKFFFQSSISLWKFPGENNIFFLCVRLQCEIQSILLFQEIKGKI